MKTLFVRYKVFLLLVCLGLALLLAGCGGDEEATDTPSFKETDSPTPDAVSKGVIVPTPEPFQCYNLVDLPRVAEGTPAPTALPGATLQNELPVIPGQVVLTGPPKDIVRVIDEVTERLDVRLTAIGPPPGQGILFGAPTGDGQWAVALYATDKDKPVPETIRQVYQVVIDLNRSGADPVAVLVNPNRLVGNPWGVDADPWGVDADPAKGPPETASIPGEQIASAWNQWALVEDSGVGVFESPSTTTASGQRVPEKFGDGIDVFVLDTSPFDTEGKKEIIGRDMCVYLPELIVDIAPDTKESQVHQHGYFVSGLVRFVAPNSRLHLVRILNEDGVGDVFSFLAVMHQLMAARNDAQLGIDMKRSVVNLSMSLDEFDDEDAASEFLPDADQILALKDVLPEEYHSYITQIQVIPALELMMEDMYNNGAVIVAASGNDSNMAAAVPTDKPTGIPANLTSTVGVAGSNFGTGRSCFSNQPEKPEGLLAPAGEGIPKSGDSCAYPFPWSTPPPKCPNGVSAYDCQVALTSVVIAATGEITYAHWVGTSFATPLVTGAAAIMLDAGSGACSAQDVTAWLHMQKDVLNVPQAWKQAQMGCLPPP